MTELEAYIYDFEGEQREIMLHFHNLFTADLNLTGKMRFKIPFYYGKTWICYLNPIKEKGIELAFIRGNELSNDQGLLQKKGRKQVAGIDFFKVKDINMKILNEIIQEALILDEMIPYKLKKNDGNDMLNI